MGDGEMIGFWNIGRPANQIFLLIRGGAALIRSAQNQYYEMVRLAYLRCGPFVVLDGCTSLSIAQLARFDDLE